MMELSSEKSSQLSIGKELSHKRASLQMFDILLNTLLDIL